MQLGKFTWPAPRWDTFSLVRDERGEYDTATATTDDGAAAATPPPIRFELQNGLSPAEVDAHTARARRAGDIGHRTVAFYLAECADRGLHQALGHPSVIPYAVKRHCIPRRCARDLIAAG